MYVSVIKDEVKVTLAIAEETVVVFKRTIPNVSLSFAEVIALSAIFSVVTALSAILAVLTPLSFTIILELAVPLALVVKAVLLSSTTEVSNAEPVAIAFSVAAVT